MGQSVSRPLHFGPKNATQRLARRGVRVRPQKDRFSPMAKKKNSSHKLGDLLKDSWAANQNTFSKGAPRYRTDGTVARRPRYQQENFDFLKLIQKWPEIVGEKLAQETAPLKNRAKTLTVLTKHAAFSQQISFMEGPLRKKIIQFFPALEGKIDRINFISNPTAFYEEKEKVKKWHRAPEEQAPPKLHPYSPEFKKLNREAEELFGDVEDEEMTKSLKSLYIEFNRST